MNHLATILELKDIEKSYGEQKILNQVSFSVEEGEVLVILGPSGCGNVVSMAWNQFKQEELNLKARKF